MKYNFDYINLEYRLIEVFLLNADTNVLDISYSIDGDKLTLQIVLLQGFRLSQATVASIKSSFSEFEIMFIEQRLTREQFNANKGEWHPIDYRWLDHLLFSKECT